MTYRPHAAEPTDRLLPAPMPGALSPTVAPLVGPWWVGAEIVLVADRKPGSTHKFFRNWRIEVVAGAEQAAPGRTLLTIPISQQTLVDSGWQYQLRRQASRPGFEALDTATFSWAARTTATIPDPFAAATAQASAWLAAAATAGADAVGPAFPTDPRGAHPHGPPPTLHRNVASTRSTPDTREERPNE